MKYFILTGDVENDEEDAMLSGYSEYLDRIRIPFNDGEILPLDDILLPIDLLVEINSLRGKMTDYLHIDEINCPIITNKTTAFLEKKQIKNHELLPIKLIDSYSNADEVEEAELKDEKLEYIEKIYENYSILNISGLIECIDHEASDLEYYEPRQEIPKDLPENMKTVLLEKKADNDVDFIKKLVLDESKIPEDTKIFRLKDCPRILVFKEEIVQAIREEKLTGFVFIPIDKYTDGISDDDEKEVEIAKKPKPTETETLQTEEPQDKEKPVRRSIIIRSIKRNQE